MRMNFQKSPFAHRSPLWCAGASRRWFDLAGLVQSGNISLEMLIMVAKSRSLRRKLVRHPAEAGQNFAPLSAWRQAA